MSETSTIQQMLKSNRFSYGLIILFLVFFFSPMIIKGNFPYYRDAISFYYPLVAFLKQSMAQGEFPLWNPHVYMGTAIWQCPDPNLIYPFNWLFVLLPFNWAINWIIFSHHVIAALGMFLWLKQQKISQESSLLFALVFSLSGFLLSLHNNHGFLVACAWMPWCLIALENFIKHSNYKHLTQLMAFGSILMLSGRPDMIYYFAIYFLIFMLYLLFQKREKPSKTLISGLILAPLIVCLISSVLVAAMLETKQFAFNTFYGNTYSIVTLWSLVPAKILTLFVPSLFGNHFYASDLGKFLGEAHFGYDQFIINIYLGVGTLIAFSASLFHWRKNQLIAFHIILLVLFMGLAFGKYNAFYTLLYDYFPGLSVFRYPIKAFGIAMLSIIFLGAQGLDILSKKQIPKSFAILMSSVFSLVVLIGIYFEYSQNIIAILKNLSPNQVSLAEMTKLIAPEKLNSYYWLFVTIFALYMGLLLLLKSSKIQSKIWQILFIGMTLLDLSYYNQDTMYLTNHDLMFMDSPIREYISQIEDIKVNHRLFYQSAFDTVPEEFYVIDQSNIQAIKQALNLPVWLFMRYTVASVKTNFSMTEDFLSTDGYLSPPSIYLHAMDIRKQVKKSYLLAPHHRERLLALMGSSHIYYQSKDKDDQYIDQALFKNHRYFPKYQVHIAELKNKLPRLYKRSKYILTAEAIESFDLVTKGEKNGRTFDPFQQVVISINAQNQNTVQQFIARKSSPLPIASKEPVFLDTGNNELNIYSAHPKKSFLVLSDVFYPGWKAYVDGKETPILLANFFQRALALEPGMHHIQFKYIPQNYQLSRFISFSGWLLMALIGLSTLFQSKNKQRL